MQALIAGITLYCIAIGLVQLTFLLTLGWLESRRIRREGDQALRAAAEELARTGTYVPPDQWQPQAVFAIVPCLDEALVIDPTVRALVASSPLTRVVVVDDASDDGTREAALACGDPRVTVLRRELPEARLGKGPALNHAFAWICEQVAAEALDPDRVLVLVMDADGRLSEGAIAKVASLFADPRVGGAQLGVRIRNRADNVLATIQDIEFWGIAALGQLGRIRTATVSLGGNGQFARFAALRSVGDAPWSPALTEDLDLAITLSIQGWHLTSHSECWVSQQGLTEIRPLIKQRTRWFQGHMTTAVTRLGELWRSPHLSNTSVLEVTSYLLIPSSSCCHGACCPRSASPPPSASSSTTACRPGPRACRVPRGCSRCCSGTSSRSCPRSSAVSCTPSASATCPGGGPSCSPTCSWPGTTSCSSPAGAVCGGWCAARPGG
ncbi:MAG: glycosyltransferase [Acidimicrobiales bacterium]